MPAHTSASVTARAERVLVVGAGGHGRVVADLVRALGHDVVGYADADEAKLGQPVDAAGGSVVLTQDALVACVEGGAAWPVPVDAIALGVGDNGARARVLALLARGALPPLVHPTAWVSASAHLGRGAVVLPGAVVHTQAEVGAGAIVNTRAVVEHDCRVGTAAHLSPGAILCGGVTVGDRSWVAAGAVVIPLCRVGADSIVGAGAVVIRDVPDGVTAVGNPARVVGASRAASSLPGNAAHAPA